MRRSAGIWFCRFVFDKKANRQMLLNGSSEFIGMSVRKVLRRLRFWDSLCTEWLEKLGNSHQAPQKDPLFVYFCLFYTFLIPFQVRFAPGFCPLQKCKVLGG